jgi:hypothetical protein
LEPCSAGGEYSCFFIGWSSPKTFREAFMTNQRVQTVNRFAGT